MYMLMHSNSDDLERKKVMTRAVQITGYGDMMGVDNGCVTVLVHSSLLIGRDNMGTFSEFLAKLGHLHDCTVTLIEWKPNAKSIVIEMDYRLIAPGSEWRLHRDWFEKSAMADLLCADFGLAESHKLYACHDRLLAHKEELFSHLVLRWRDLFNASFDVLLYDLTSTYFEINAADVPEGDKRRHGYSRDKRPDCPQVVIALIVTPDGLPIAYEVLAGNTSDKKTLRSFLEKIAAQYGKARRVWVMDRGIPTEEVLAEMRASEPPVHYLVGTPKGRLNRLEKHLIDKPWREAREGVQVKLLAEADELYVFA